MDRSRGSIAKAGQFLALAGLVASLAACAATHPAAGTHWHRLDGKARDPAELEAALFACVSRGLARPVRSDATTACMLKFGYVWLQGV